MMKHIFRNCESHSHVKSSNNSIAPSSNVPNNQWMYNDEDFYTLQQGYAQCCYINVLVGFCMIIGLYCLFSYDDPNLSINNNLNNSKIFIF